MTRESIAALVRLFLDQERPALITPADLTALRRFVTQRSDRKVSDALLLRLLEGTDVEIDRSLGALPLDLRDRIRTREPALAADSLVTTARDYVTAIESADRRRANDCRRAVLAGKERLKRTLRNPRISDAKRAEKEELLGWFLQWLEAPALFADWLELRRRSSEIRTPRD